MMEFAQALKEVLGSSLFTISDEDRKQIASSLVEWLTDVARKKPVPDLLERVERLKKQIEQMARNISVEYSHGRFVIKTDSDSEAVLRMFRKGTDWFDPHNDVDGAIISALLSSASS